MLVALGGPDDGREQLPGVVPGEHEAGPRPSVRVEVADGVDQAARRSDHGDGAIAHPDQLAEAAGLEPGRHQDHVGAGVDQLGQVVVEADRGRHLVRVLGRLVAEEVLVAAVPGAEDNELEALLDDRRQGLLDKVEALLVVESRDHRDDRCLALGEAEHRPEVGLVEALGRRLGGRVMVKHGRVRLRVEELDVDAVDDPVQLVRLAAEEGVHPLAELRFLDLLRVALADGVDDVGEVNAAAEDVDDVVEVWHADLQQAPGFKAGEVQRAGAEDTLKGEIVNGEDGRDPRHLGVLAVEHVEQVRHQRCMPVVDMDHVRDEAERSQHREQGAVEVDEARVVVAEAVDAVPVVELGAIDEVDRHLTHPALEDRAGDRLRPERHLQVLDHRLEVVHFRVDLPVERHHDADVLPQPAELFGKRRGDVGEAAGLGEGRHLGGGEEDFQRLAGGIGPEHQRARHAKAERACRWHPFQLGLAAADRQRELERLAGSLLED